MPFLLPLLFRLGLPERIARPLATIIALAAVAALCATLGYCKGRSDGKAQVRLEVSESARKLEHLARKVEEQANLLDRGRQKARAAQSTELKGLAHEKGTNAAAGPGVRAVLGRVRERQAGGGDHPTR